MKNNNKIECSLCYYYKTSTIHSLKENYYLTKYCTYTKLNHKYKKMEVKDA